MQKTRSTCMFQIKNTRPITYSTDIKARRIVCVILVALFLLCIGFAIFSEPYFGAFVRALAAFTALQSLYYLIITLYNKSVSSAFLDIEELTIKENSKPLFSIGSYQIAINQDNAVRHMGNFYPMILMLLYLMIIISIRLIFPEFSETYIFLFGVVLYLTTEGIIVLYLNMLRLYRIE